MPDLRKRVEALAMRWTALSKVYPTGDFDTGHIHRAGLCAADLRVALALPDDPPAAALRGTFAVGAKWAWLWWDGQEASLDAEALSRYPNPPAAVLPEQTHARDPQVYPVSGVTRRVVGHVVPGPAPKREKRWRCATCGRRVTRIENVLGILCHIVGKNARCGPVVEEVSDA